jgi:hypothetical protein
MKIKIPKVIIFFAILVFAFGLGTGFSLMVSPENLGTKNSSYSEISIDIEIDYGSENVQSFSGEIFWEGASALDSLKSLERRHGIALELREISRRDVLIEGINGIRNTRNSFWQYEVNGESAQIKPENYTLQDGDKILWRRM